MAEKRMFTMKICDSDAFLDMPHSTQNLYFHLNLRADDDGFINNPKRIQRIINASEDDLKLLLAKRFILAFESGVIVIKHWRMHNTIQSDRYKATPYQDELNTMVLKANKSYKLAKEIDDKEPIKELETKCIQNVSIGLDIGLGLDEDLDIEKEKIRGTSTRFIPPTLELVQSYITENKYSVDAQRFIDFYESKGWYVGKNKMKNWQAAVRTWANDKPKQKRVGRVEQVTQYVVPQATLTKEEEQAIKESLSKF